MLKNPTPLTRLSRRLFARSFNSRSKLPCLFPVNGNYNVFNDPNISPLIQVLREHNPGLLFGLTQINNSIARMSEIERSINETNRQYQEQMGLSAETQGALVNFPGHRIKEPEVIIRKPPTKPNHNQSELLLCVGLSFMLTLGICQFMGLEIPYISLQEFPLFVLSIITGISINLAEYLAIFRSSVSRRKLIKPEDGFMVFLNDPFVLIYLLTIFLEISIAVPGLVDLLPPHLSSRLDFQITVYAAAGLAAFVNIYLAYSNSQAEIRYQIELAEYEQDYIQELKELEAKGELREIRIKNISKELDEESKVGILRALHHQAACKAEVLKNQKSDYALYLNEAQQSFKSTYLKWQEDLLDWLWVNNAVLLGKTSGVNQVENQAESHHSNGRANRK
jgi:hypothetical protein